MWCWVKLAAVGSVLGEAGSAADMSLPTSRLLAERGHVRRYHHRRRRRYIERCEDCCGVGAYRLFLNTADSYCEPCPVNTYWPATRPGKAVYDCLPCAAGRFQPIKGQTSCHAPGGGDDDDDGQGNVATASPDALRIGAPITHARTSAAAAVEATVGADCAQLAFVVDSIVDVSPASQAGHSFGFARYVATRVALRAALAKVVELQLEQVTVAAAPREEVTLQPGGSGGAQGDHSAPSTNRFRTQLFVSDSETALGLVELFKMQHFDHALHEIAPGLRFETSFSKVLRIAHARTVCKGSDSTTARLGGAGNVDTAAAADGVSAAAAGRRTVLARELVVGVAMLVLVVIFVMERRKFAGSGKGHARYSKVQASQHNA